MKDLDKIMAELDLHQKITYDHLIDLHNNNKLRQYAALATHGFLIARHKNYYGRQRTLHYGSEGLEYFPSDRDSFRRFSVKNNVLVDNYKKKLWDLFPQLSVQFVYSQLENQIKKLDMYKVMESTHTGNDE